MSRRIELHADCMMGMTGIAVRTTELNDQDREEMVRRRTAAADDSHGRTASSCTGSSADSTPSRAAGAALDGDQSHWLRPTK